jgi:glycosyltransferase involved in cell wall biosynthesis
MTAAGDECAVLAQRARGVTGEIQTPYRLMRFANPRSSVWAGWWIERHLKRLAEEFGEPEVLIGHHAFPPGYACVSYGRRRGIPSVVYPRGGDIYEVSRFRQKKHAWRKLTWALREASAVVCASAAMEELVRQIIGGDAGQHRLVRIPNGVNVEEMRGDASGSRFAGDARYQAPFVLGLGRIIRRKGFGLLIDAFGASAAKDWKLVIAGDGREMDTLRAQAQPLGDCVLFPGLVEGADKRWLLQYCRFMAAPSLEESFGNVALEAMACGKPVIASRASGFAEIVRDGENGRLVAVGDAGALGDAIKLFQAADLGELSRCAAKTAEAFSWPTIAARYRALISELTGRSPS